MIAALLLLACLFVVFPRVKLVRTGPLRLLIVPGFRRSVYIPVEVNPWLWRAFMGRYEHQDILGGPKLIRYGKIKFSDEGMQIKGGMTSEKNLVSKYRKRVNLALCILLSVAILATGWNWLIVGVGVTEVWDGDIDDDSASDDTKWVSGSAPASGDTAQFDATSVVNCDWDLTAITTIDVQAGYTGIILQSVNLAVSNLYTLGGNATRWGTSTQDLTVTNTVTIDNNTAAAVLVIQGGTTTFNGAVNVGTGLNPGSIQMDASSGTTILQIGGGSVVNINATNGLFDFVSNGTNTCIIQGDATTQGVWNGIAPDWDSGGAGSRVRVGDSGSSRKGMDFSTNSIDINTGSAGMRFDIHGDSSCDALTFVASDIVTFSSSTMTMQVDGNLTATAALTTLDFVACDITVSGNWDTSGINTGFGSGGSVTMDGSGVTFDTITNETVRAFNCSGTVSTTTQIIFIDGGSSGFVNTGTWTMTGVSSIINDTGITGFDNSSGIITGTGTLVFQPDTSTVTIGSGGSTTYGTITPTLVRFGNNATGSVLLGGNFTSGNVEVTAQSTGNITVDLVTFTLDCDDFTLLTPSSGDAILLGGTAATLTCSGDCDLSAGTYTRETGEIQMDGLDGTITVGSNSRNFFSITINDDTVVTGNSTFITGTLSIASGKVYTLGQSVSLFDAAIANLSNLGEIAGSSSRNLLFVLSDTTAQTTPASIGTITVPVIFEATATISTNVIITLGGAFTTDDKVTIRSNDPTFTLSLDAGGFALNFDDLDITDTDGVLIGNSSTITCTGDADMSGGTFTQDTSTFVMSGGAGTEVLLTGASSDVFYNLTLSTAAKAIDGAGGVGVSNAFVNTVVCSLNRDLIITTSAGCTAFDNSAGTIQNGTSGNQVIFNMDGSNVPAMDNFGTLNVTGQIQVRGSSGSSNTLTLAEPLTISSDIRVRDIGGTNTTLDCASFALNCDGVLVEVGATIDLGSSASHVVSVSWDTSAGSFDDGSSTVTFDTGVTITTDGTSAQAFNNVEKTGTGTVTLASDIFIAGLWDWNSVTATLNMANNDMIFIPTTNPWANSVNMSFTNTGIVIFRPGGVVSFGGTGAYTFPNWTLDGTNGTLTITMTGELICEDLIVGLAGLSTCTLNLIAQDVTCDELTVVDVGILTAVGSGSGQTITNSAGFDIDGTVNFATSGTTFITLERGSASGTMVVDGTLTLDASGSSVVTIWNENQDVTWNASASITVKGSAAISQLDFNGLGGAGVNIAGDLTLLDWDFVDYDSSNTSQAIVFNAFQTGTFTMTDSSITASVSAAEAILFNNHAGTYDSSMFQDLTLTSGATGIDVQTAGASVPNVNMTACDIDTARGTGGNYIAAVGVTPDGAFDTFRLWGPLTYDSAYDTAQVGSAGLNGIDIELRNDDGGGSSHGNLTVDIDVNASGVESILAETSTTLTVATTRTLEIDAASSASSHTIDSFSVVGTFQWDDSGGSKTLNLTDTATITGTWTTQHTASGNTIKISDSEHIRVNDAAAVIIIEGNSWANRITVTTEDSPTNGGNVRITLSASTSSFRYVHFDALGHNVANFNTAILLDGNSAGTMNQCRIENGVTSNILHSMGSPTWTIKNMELIGGTNGFVSTVSGNDGITLRTCSITGASGPGLRSTNVWAGLYINCNSMNNDTGILTVGNAPAGTIVDCTFASNTSEDVAVNSGTTELVGCVFDETSIALFGGTQLISHLHQRTNNKAHFIGSSITVDVNTMTVVNEDTFPWSWTAGQWDINSSNQFEAALATSTIISAFIPVAPSTAYYFKYEGSIGATADTTLEAYEVDQATSGGTTLSSATGTTPIVAVGSQFEGTITTTATGVFLKIDFDAAGVGETFFAIEIRETDSSGALIYNEDLLNNYTWPGVGHDFFGLNYLVAAGISTDMWFGDSDYNQTVLQAKFTGAGQTDNADRAGFIFDIQDANNAMDCFVGSDGADYVLFVFKTVGGVGTKLFSATGSTVNTQMTGVGDIITVHRSDPSITGATVGSIQVFINGTVIPTADWVAHTGGTIDANDFVVDTTYSAGRVGFTVENAITVDNMIVKHAGLFLRDVDLIMGAGAVITIASDGVVDLNRGTANISRTLVSNAGSFTDLAWVWADSNFDELIEGVFTIGCTDSTSPIEVDTDITFGAAGQLTLTGAIFQHENSSVFWTIKTEGSTVEPPMVVNNSVFKNLNARFRPHDVSFGGPYEVDPNGSGREILRDGPAPEKPVVTIKNEVFGRSSMRSTVKSFGDYTTTLRFFSTDQCLYGTLRDWMNQGVLLDVIYPKGYINKCIIIDLFDEQSFPALNAFEWAVTLEEFR